MGIKRFSGEFGGDAGVMDDGSDAAASVAKGGKHPVK